MEILGDLMTTKLQYTSENLLVLPENNKEDPDRILSITPKKAGWELISFEVRRLEKRSKLVLQNC